MRTSVTTRQSDSATTPFPTFSQHLEDFLNSYPFHTTLMDRGDAWRPAVDIHESDGNLVLRAEIPGINERDIEVKLEGNVLTLKGERKPETEDRNNYYLQETFHGSFTRSFTLPETVDAEKIKADYKNGILTITIPQKPEVKPRSIPVSAG